jgi:hypothetical protein
MLSGYRAHGLMHNLGHLCAAQLPTGWLGLGGWGAPPGGCGNTSLCHLHGMPLFWWYASLTVLGSRQYCRKPPCVIIAAAVLLGPLRCRVPATSDRVLTADAPRCTAAGTHSVDLEAGIEFSPARRPQTQSSSDGQSTPATAAAATQCWRLLPVLAVIMSECCYCDRYCDTGSMFSWSSGRH